MGKISDLLAEGKTISYEFFPPKTEEGQANLDAAVTELAGTDPSFFSVTYGAGGSTRGLTRDLVVDLDSKFPFPTMPHLTCIGHTQPEISDLLDDYVSCGIENVLSLAGDPPIDGSQPTGDFHYSSELVELVKARGDLCVGVAAFPEGHPRSASLSNDRKFLAAKLEMADFGITQFFFGAPRYFQMVEDLASLGEETPILPGIMPMLNPASIRRFAEMNGTTFDDDLAARVDAASGEDQTKIAVAAAIELSQALLDGGAPGVHIYALNRSDVPLQIISGLSV